MPAITALLLGALAASPAVREEISMDCLTAVNHALHYISAKHKAGNPGSSDDVNGSDNGGDAVETRYDRASCLPSNVVPGRIYIHMTPKGGPLYRSHTYYVVEPSGEVTVRRDMPCSENPSVCE